MGQYRIADAQPVATAGSGRYRMADARLPEPAAKGSPEWVAWRNQRQQDLAPVAPVDRGFIHGAWDSLKGIPAGISAAINDPEGPLVGAGRAIVDPAIEQGRRAAEAWRNGDRTEAVAHAMAAALPMAGPAAAQAGEAIGEGRTGEGLGQAAVLLAPSVLHAAAPTAARAAEALPTAETAWAATKGAAKGGVAGAKAEASMGHYRVPVPASVAGGYAGLVLGGKVGMPYAGAVMGGAVPIIKGAVKGAKAAAAASRFEQARAAARAAAGPRPAPVWSEIPESAPPPLPEFQPIPGSLPSGRVPGRPRPVAPAVVADPPAAAPEAVPSRGRVAFDAAKQQRLEDAADAADMRAKSEGESAMWQNRARKADRFAKYFRENELDPTPENISAAAKQLAEREVPSAETVDLIHDRLGYTPDSAEPPTEPELQLQDSLDAMRERAMKEARGTDKPAPKPQLVPERAAPIVEMTLGGTVKKLRAPRKPK